jgi:hypothetical protein
MLRDIHTHLSPIVSVIPQNRTTSVSGTGVDLALYSAAEVSFSFGNSADTLSGTVYVTAVVQHSDTDVDGDYTDVSAGDLLGSITVVDAPSEDSTVQSVGYIGNKRYVRARFVLTGTHTTGIPLAANVIRGARRYGSGTIV